MPRPVNFFKKEFTVPPLGVTAYYKHHLLRFNKNIVINKNSQRKIISMYSLTSFS